MLKCLYFYTKKMIQWSRFENKPNPFTMITLPISFNSMLYIILALDEDDYTNIPDAISYADLELSQVSFNYNSGHNYGYCFYTIGL